MKDISYHKMMSLHEKLLKCLNEEETKLFIEYEDAVGVYSMESHSEDFERGFRQAFRLVFASLLHE
jgi:hypothetical protein